MTWNNDGVTYLGCTDTCETAPGWVCEDISNSDTEADLDTTARKDYLSKCTQTCGDGTRESDEECDTGNAYYDFL